LKIIEDMSDSQIVKTVVQSRNLALFQSISIPTTSVQNFSKLYVFVNICIYSYEK